MKKRGKEHKDIFKIFIRYLVLIALGIPNLWLFYSIFTPLTIYAVYFILGIFFNVSLINNVIIVSGRFPIEIIDACVAGAAYYLLMIFNLSTPKVELKKRINSLVFSFSSLFIVNILRIVVLSFFYVGGKPWFDTLHLIFWYAGSVLVVIGIWFLETRIFKIKEIPFYSDLKSLFQKIRVNSSTKKTRRKS
jgi:exosortase/archaeosortase family protein